VCNGLLTSDFSITRLDAQGVQQLYGDFKTSMLWHAPNGQTSVYFMNDTFQASSVNVDSSLWVPDSTGWKIADYNDFNKDGKRDFVWHHSNGDVQMWFMNGYQRLDYQNLDPTLNIPDSSGWVMQPSGDFNKDGNPDIWWHNSSSGAMQVWFMDGMTRLGYQDFASSLNFADSTGWRIVTVNDFNQDGNPDILLNNATTGVTRIWYMNGMARTSIGDLDSSLNIVASSGWRIISANDFNSDGRSDIVWWHPFGAMQAWFMNGHARLGYQDFQSGSFPSIATGLTPITR
jgi:ketosteroid isomerase-like protein